MVTTCQTKTKPQNCGNANRKLHKWSMLANVKLPYVLIEKQPAWKVLQKIANFACCYVFADRDGRVVLEEDGFSDNQPITGQTAEMRTYQKRRT